MRHRLVLAEFVAPVQPPGSAGHWQSPLAALLATTLVMGTMPVGCAATDEYAVVASPQADVAPVEQEFPEAVAANLKSCAKAGGSRLERNSYDVEFEVQADADHVVQEAKLNGGRLDDAETEACFIKALKQLPIDDIVRRQGSVSSTSQLVSTSSRGFLGNTAALPQLIRLAPIVLTAPGGITIVVGVVIVVAVVAVVSKLSEECEEEKKWAIENCSKYISWNDPPWEVIGPGRDRKIAECIRNTMSVDCGGKAEPKKRDNHGRNGRRF